MAAPSAQNQQPWQFVVITEAGTTDAPRAVTVIMRDYRFDPTPIVLVPGETVALVPEAEAVDRPNSLPIDYAHAAEEARPGMSVLLADVEELSYKEIADVVGCPIGTVMSRLHRARKQLQGSLHKHAMQLGIIEGGDDDAEDPVSLEAFRSRKAVKS